MKRRSNLFDHVSLVGLKRLAENIGTCNIFAADHTARKKLLIGATAVHTCRRYTQLNAEEQESRAR